MHRKEAVPLGKLTKNVDILVVGAGMAGVLAALAAAKNNPNPSVAIVEKNTMPGGQVSSALVSEMSGYTYRGREIYGGIQKELIDYLISVNAAKLYYNTPLVPSTHARMDKLVFNTEVMKIILNWFVAQSAVEAIGGCRLHRVELSEGGVRTFFHGGHDELEISAKIVIDATGDAEVAYLAGLETVKSISDEKELSTLLFRLSDIAAQPLEKFMLGNGMNEVVLKGHKSGFLPRRHISIAPIPGTRDVVINATRTFVDSESEIDITKGTIETLNQILRIAPFLKQNVPGMESAALAAIAPALGIRDARRIAGRTVVTENSIANLVRYPDEVAIGCAPMGVYDSIDDDINWTGVLGIYRIPISAMLPKDSDRIIAAGRCISCSDKALSTIRSIPAVMNTGEVAGYTAALAVNSGTTPDKLRPEDLQDFLRNKGLFSEYDPARTP